MELKVAGRDKWGKDLYSASGVVTERKSDCYRHVKKKERVLPAEVTMSSNNHTALGKTRPYNHDHVDRGEGLQVSLNIMMR